MIKGLDILPNNRRWAILLALLALLLPCFAMAQSQVGDMNGTDGITAGDAAVALRAVYGLIHLDNAQSITADVTGNMQVDASDVTGILLACTGRLNSFSDLMIPGSSLLGEKHFEEFSFGDRIIGEEEYRSSRIALELSQTETETAICRIANLYLVHTDSLKTAFSGGGYLKEGSLAGTEVLAKKNGAVFAINGDQYSQGTHGPLVRNGIWYRENLNKNQDACVLYDSGVIKTFTAGEYRMEDILAEGTPWQSWVCGPSLLDGEGKPLRYFTKSREATHRITRMALGYFEPGHYCFVLARGSADGTSTGMTVTELADFMSQLGCKAAFQLPGGETATMVFRDGIVDAVREESRAVSDIIYIVDPEQGGQGK